MNDYQVRIVHRNPFLCVVLSLVTCGLYGLYWITTLHQDACVLAQEQDAPSAGTVLILSLVTCGIYSFYWMYRQGERIDTARKLKGLSIGSHGILYLLLSLFGLSMIAMALTQHEINQLA